MILLILMKGMDIMDNKIQLYPANKFCMPLVYYSKYANKPMSYYVEELSPLNGKDAGHILNINSQLGIIEPLKNISMEKKIIFNDLGYEDKQLSEKRFQSFTEKYNENLITKLSEIRYENEDLINRVFNSLISLNSKFSESVEPIIITISGLYESIYTSIIASILKSKLENSGNRVVVLSDHPSIQSVSMPLFGTRSKIFKSISTDEIYELNVKLKAVEMSLHPDFIIIDIPGGLMRADEFFMNDFGIPLWSVMQSIKPDFYFNIVPATHYGSDYKEIINEYLSKSFDINVDFYIVTNEFYQFQPTMTYTLPETEFRNISDDRILHDMDSNNVLCVDSLESPILDSWAKDIVSYKLDCI